MALKTDYKDDIIATGTQRKYTQTTNSDGTVSFTDSTEYQQTGDTFGAKDINATNIEVNKLEGVKKVTLKANEWTGSAAPYQQIVTVDGIRSTDSPVLVSLLADGASEATQKAYSKAFGIVSSGTGSTSDGSVTFKVYKKPATDITVGLKGV